MVLALGGDVMIGRGIDQILAQPSNPVLHESFIKDARDYVALAEETSGPIPRAAGPDYIWGDALECLAALSPAARLINLETSVTDRSDYWKGKGINYRMHPANVDCLKAFDVSVCTLANNHVLDYGYQGLSDTLAILQSADIKTAGAGLNANEARRPAIVDLPGPHRLLLFSIGDVSSGIPATWGAREDRPGVDLIPDLSNATADALIARVCGAKRSGDLTLVSIHWGSNWGYEVPASHSRFAHRLIDGGVDVVHGHSSHHPRPVEVYRDRLVLYGCGDLLNDYEGISGYEEFHSQLVLLYCPDLDRDTGALGGLRLAPWRIRRLRLNRPSLNEIAWLAGTLNRISADFGSTVEVDENGWLRVRW